MRSRLRAVPGTSPIPAPISSASRLPSPPASASASFPRLRFSRIIAGSVRRMAFPRSPTPRSRWSPRRKRARPPAGSRRRWPTSAAPPTRARRRDPYLPALLPLLLDELIGVEVLERRFALDDPLRQIEVLQIAQPLDIDLAELPLAWIDQRGVVVERGLDRAFLALPFRNEVDEILGGLVGVVHDVLHAAQRRLDELAHELGLLLEHLIGHPDPLRHVREELVGGDHLDLHARGLHRRDPVRNSGHADRLAGGDELPYPGRAA